jgi:3-hydroxymyristoyl/3-hydroxydecanoyl-(acyl carrier protein) dehydratase
LSFPTVISRTEDGDTIRFEFDINEDLHWFQGHFPGFPVLPGVVQLRWAVELAQENFGFEAGPHEVMRLKFKSIIVPPVAVELTLTQTGPSQAQFKYTGQGQEYSQGRLVFSEQRQ